MRDAFIAVAFGLCCHIAFVTAIGIMMIVLFSGMQKSIGAMPTLWAWLVNSALLLQFPILHSALLSRRGQEMLGRLAPFQLGRSLASTTFALIASIQTIILFLCWTPSGHIIWRAHGYWLAAITAANVAAWLLLLKAIIDAGIGLQTGFLGWWAVLQRRKPVYPPMPTQGLFRLTRQPIYVAFALILWTLPTVTLDSLVVSVALTTYCILGPLYKEARFVRRFGPDFVRYRARVPYWVPWPRGISVSAPSSTHVRNLKSSS